MTIQEILGQAEKQLKSIGIESARLDAEVLLAHILGYDRSHLIIHTDNQINADKMAEFIELVQKRGQHQPVAYLTGHKEFMGLDFLVTPAVLIPRPETEILIETTIEIAQQVLETKRNEILKILDIGTGSGNIAISLAKNILQTTITAIDISDSAIHVAQKNAERHQVDNRIKFNVSDIFENIEIKNQAFDIIVSNPPYIAEPEFAELTPEITQYEPRTALSGGPDGLQIISRIISESPNQLNPNGYLILEIGDKQGALVQKLIESNPQYALQSLRIINDLAGKDRVIVIQRKYQ